MKIEVVSHCFRYPTLLRFQLSSLVQFPPANGMQVVATVFYAGDDVETKAVLEWFAQQQVPGVAWNWQELPVLSLCRRSIGRNLAALATQADWVWFCDADYWFKAECWEFFATLSEDAASLIYPQEVMTHREHALGDAAVARALQTHGLLSIDPSEFEPRPMNRAIGGIQIVRGEVCREKGYLPNHRKAQAPTRHAVFEKNFADVWFRKELGTDGVAVALPGVYRIRHSQTGREVPGLQL